MAISGTLQRPNHHRTGLNSRLPIKFSVIGILIGLSLLIGSIYGSAQTSPLKVAMDNNYPPQEFLMNSQPSGFNIDIWNEIGQELEREIQFYDMDWDNVIESLKNGTSDAIIAVNTPERQTFFDFSEPILNVTQRIFVRNDWSGISDVYDLANHTVAVQADDIGQNYLQLNVPDAHLVIVENQQEALDKLMNQEVGAIFGNYHTILYYIHTFNFEENVKVIGEEVIVGGYCIAVQKGNSELLNQINIALGQLAENGKYDEIYEKWYGTTFPNTLNTEFLSKYTLWIIGGLLGFILIISILLLWTSTLRRTIQKKTIELENNQKLLLQQDRIEALGHLAGGIAHDFNNILTIILGNLSLAKMETDESEEIFELINESEQASLQGKNLANQLLTFSKGGTPIKKKAHLEQLVKEIVKFSISGKNVKCIYNISQDLWDVNVDTGQISQVINNLVINSLQAMNQQGSIKIFASNEEIKRTNALSLSPGKYVHLIFEDSGPGIPKKNLQKIFDPYFTTKAEGVGLGLATSFSIIVKHEGYIYADSIPNKGGIFHILLPAYTSLDEEFSKVFGSTEEPKKIIKGQGRILVLDDDIGILKSISKMLQQIGYIPTTTNTSQKAINLYKEAYEKNQKFDAMIIDLTIKGDIPGIEVINSLQKIDPNIKAIVSSGYSHIPVMSDHKKYGFQEVLPKPYTLENLSEKLNTMLNKHDFIRNSITEKKIMKKS